jgi:hypothetical protein
VYPKEQTIKTTSSSSSVKFKNFLQSAKSSLSKSGAVKALNFDLSHKRTPFNCPLNLANNSRWPAVLKIRPQYDPARPTDGVYHGYTAVLLEDNVVVEGIGKTRFKDSVENYLEGMELAG